MSLNPAWSVRCVLAVLVVSLASGCPDPQPPQPPPPAADTTPPSTRANPMGGTTTTGVTVSLLCEDGSGSGCKATHYTTDGSEPTTSSPTYSAPVSLAASTTLKFFSVDNAGNREAVKTETYVIDGTAPTTTATPAGGTYATATRVTLTCSDGSGTGCKATYYTTDGSEPTTGSAVYSGPIDIRQTTALKFFSVDDAGNAESVKMVQYDVTIDAATPVVSATPAGGAYTSAQTVVLKCNDGGGSGCKALHYTTDGSEPTTSSPEYTAALAVDANTVIKFLAEDNAGNVSAVKTETYVIDGVAPTTKASPAGGLYQVAQTVTLACSDDNSGCKATYYTVDGSTPTASSTQYTASLSITSATTLKFFSVDNAGNAEAVKTAQYNIDGVAPVTTATPIGGLYNSSRSVTLVCTDDNSGCVATHYTTDGSTPTTSSPTYSAPLTLATTTTLKFFSVDSAGNAEAVKTQSYTIDTVAPATTNSPAAGLYESAQSVTLACSDSGGGGCKATHYTTNGSTPTTSSPTYTAPIAIAASTTLKFFSVDNAGNAEAVKTAQYTLAIGPNISAQIAAVRTSTNDPVNLPIELALVTYVKPLVGSDPAGFFLQAEKDGPAVFVAVDPASLSPVPAVGDRVSLTVLQKVSVNSMVHVTAISGFSVNAQGKPVAPLRSVVDNVDLPALVGEYESKLISLSGTLATGFSSSGTGHVAANLSNGVVTNNANLKLRVPAPLQDQLDLAQGCIVTVNGIVWRFTSQAQASGWVPADITLQSCLAPKVVSAVATSSTAVTVTFDRRIDPASVQGNGSQFTFATGLSATAATVQGRKVLLTTNTQTGGQSYEVTVSTSVRDTLGKALDATATKATFSGYRKIAVLRINEANANINNSRDLLELYVVEGGTTLGMTLVENTATLATLPDVQVATGDIIVVHFNPIASNGDAPGSETTSKSQHPQATYAANYDTAWDFHAGITGLGYSHRVLRVKDALGTTQDAVAFAVPTSTTPPNAFPGFLQTLQAEGLWLPADCGGAPCTYDSTPTAVEVSASWGGTGTGRTGLSAQRAGTADNNTASDWVFLPAPNLNTWGRPNP